MIKKRKLNKILRSTLVCMLMAFCLITALPSMETEAAAITGQETSFLLINTEIGRYKLNYTGNTNHYAYWNSITGQPVTNSIYNDVGVGLNSSTATLEKTAGASGIKYAFLVWETRAPEGATTPVYFRTPDGRYHTVSPTYAVNDWRVPVVFLNISSSCAFISLVSILQCSKTSITALSFKRSRAKRRCSGYTIPQSNLMASSLLKTMIFSTFAKNK